MTRSKRHTCTALAVVGLIASMLACNAPSPTPTSEPPAPIEAPETPSTSPQESPVEAPTQASPAETPSAPTPTEEAAPTSMSPVATKDATKTATPEGTELPQTVRPTPGAPVSAGPLDFAVPSELDDFRELPEGRFEATIILRITGGAPPYTVLHDLEAFTTDVMNPAIVFNAQGCTALVHTITVESADGQRVGHDYWIPPPWCD